MSSRSTEPGLFDAVRRLAGSALAMAQSRLELAGIELGEARDRLITTLMLAVAAALLGCAALVALSAWLVLALWDRTGPGILGGLAAAYAVAAVLLLAWLRSRARSDPPLLADTLAELRQDARALRADAGARPGSASASEP